MIIMHDFKFSFPFLYIVIIWCRQLTSDMKMQTFIRTVLVDDDSGVDVGERLTVGVDVGAGKVGADETEGVCETVGESVRATGAGAGGISGKSKKE